MNQQNSFRHTIEDGGIVLGARNKMHSPNVVEVFGELGFDFVWLDFEHAGPSPYDSTLFENLTRAADVGDIELLVRLPSSAPHLIRKVLDAGVRNLLIPRISSADEAREAVKATRFVYDGGPGERGMASGRARNWGHSENYVETEDSEVYLGVMVEKTGAVEELDDIISIPDLGFVFIGSSDLSVQMGYPGDSSHEAVVTMANEIRNRCLAANVPVGKVTHDPDDALEAIDNGCQILRVGGNFEAAQQVLLDRLEYIQNR